MSDGKTPYEVSVGPNERLMCVPVCRQHMNPDDLRLPVGTLWVGAVFGKCAKSDCERVPWVLAVTVVELEGGDVADN